MESLSKRSLAARRGKPYDKGRGVLGPPTAGRGVDARFALVGPNGGQSGPIRARTASPQSWHWPMLSKAFWPNRVLMSVERTRPRSPTSPWWLWGSVCWTRSGIVDRQRQHPAGGTALSSRPSTASRRQHREMIAVEASCPGARQSPS